jgi:peptide methionine sulfoxide reductase msrA/msrB
MRQFYLSSAFLLLFFLAGCGNSTGKEAKAPDNLSAFVTKQCGTEPPFQNKYWDEKRSGIYVDVNTGEPLFSSLDKFDSGTGWPSFTRSLENASIEEREERTLGVKRIEVRTNASHLGHVFADGPEGGSRYCINSAALRFIPYEELDRQGYGRYKGLFSLETATLAGGCFWGVEKLLEDVPGVVAVTSGYTGGATLDPTYAQVSSGKTGHAEAVEVVFDPTLLSFEELLGYFWRLHDPTQLDRQGPDRGSQYRSAIFYHDEAQRKVAEASKQAFDESKVFPVPAVTVIVPAGAFFPAEEYHQDYYGKHPGRACHALRPA